MKYTVFLQEMVVLLDFLRRVLLPDGLFPACGGFQGLPDIKIIPAFALIHALQRLLVELCLCPQGLGFLLHGL